MTQNRRIVTAVLVLVIIAAGVLGVESWRRQQQAEEQSQLSPGMATAAPGSIPIYLNGKLVGSFAPADLEQLQETSFQDAEEGKTQRGWRLADVMDLYITTDELQPETAVTISSSHRSKSVQLTWAEVADPANMVMFDLSGRGTLKLVSLLPQLDVRDEWIQDTDKIEIVK